MPAPRERGRVDAIEPKRPAALSEPAPGHQVPALRAADQRRRLDEAPFGPSSRSIDVINSEDAPLRHSCLHRAQHCAQCGLVAVAGVEQVDAAGKLFGALAAAGRHGADDLAERCAAGIAEGNGAVGRECNRDCRRLGRGEVQRRKGHRRVQAVAAARPRRGPYGHARVLERQQVALDRACTDLEAIRQPAGAARTWRSASQLVDQRIEPVGAVHL